jgi:hypothetical protein
MLQIIEISKLTYNLQLASGKSQALLRMVSTLSSLQANRKQGHDDVLEIYRPHNLNVRK